MIEFLNIAELMNNGIPLSIAIKSIVHGSSAILMASSWLTNFSLQKI